MKSINAQSASLLRVTSNASQMPSTGIVGNVESHLNGYSYTLANDQIIASKGEKSYTINPLIFAMLAATKIKIQPDLLTQGRIQDKVVIPELAIVPWDFGKDSKEPAIIEGHILNSVRYLNNCLQLLPPIEQTSNEDVLEYIDSISFDTTKQTLIDAIVHIHELLTPKAYSVDDLTVDQKICYEELLKKEEKLRTAEFDLAKYVDDFKVLSETKVYGLVKPEIANGQDKELAEEFTKLLSESFGNVTYKPVQPVLDGFSIKSRGGVGATIELK